ncbi:MAG: efflux RND transporter periplasmic adaptor subunit [Alphaproteobacteria bacterium]
MTDIPPSQTPTSKSNIIIGIIQLGIVIAFIVASILISTALGNKKIQNGQQNVTTERALIVNTANVFPRSHRITFTANGTVKARGEAQVTPQINGKVIKISDNFFAGGTFEKGETLFEIEPIDFRLQIDTLKAQVAQAQTVLNQEEAQRSAALAEWKMFNPNKPPSALVAREPQIAEARAGLRAAKAQLQTARLDLARTKVSMPFAGKTLSSTLEIGQFVTAGQSYGSVFDPSALEVQTTLNDQQRAWLQSDDTGAITITTGQGENAKTYNGILKRDAANLDTQTRFASVTIGFEETPTNILPGTFVNINITGPAQNGLTEIPANAVQNGGVVWEVLADNTLNALTPQIVVTREKTVLVKGITAPKTIVTGKLNGATTGTKVRFDSEAK